MITFIIVWLGQLVSLLGSGLTSFALGVWMFERTGSITQVALMGLFAVLPRIVLSPFVGPLVDRGDRRWIMIASDMGAGMSTLLVVGLFATGQLLPWHIYLAVSLNAAFSTLQWPAYAATTTLLVPREQLGRANGMVQLGQAIAEILAPALAGVLMQSIQLRGVILIDFATFLFAVGTLLLVRFPKLQTTGVVSQKESLWHQITYGWSYITARAGLMGLLWFSAVVNFLWGMLGALITPMILSFTSSDTLGLIVSIAGAGMLMGSLMMSVWGGPKRRIDGVLNFELLSGLCFMLIGLRPTFWLTALGAFGAHITIAIVAGSNQTIWQSKVPSEMQGRVFSTQQMFTKAAAPLAYLIAGPLAEHVFEPLLAVEGGLSHTAGLWVGIGPGRGIGLMFVLMGAIKMGVALVGRLNPQIRGVEEMLPDVGNVSEPCYIP
ncbi:MAG: MFS transporter [Anaerolineae bacterium]|nr:MFS transporter [Anaerolineae bacterium]